MRGFPGGAADMTAGADIDWRFETPRLRARLVDGRDRDRELYRNLYTDAAVMAHIGAVMSETEADVVFQKVLGYNLEWPVRARYWRLSDRSTDEVVGIQSFVRPVADPASMELGLMLLPKSQGHRLGAEASQRLVDLLLGNHWGLDAETVFARHASANDRVARLGVTLGFGHVDPCAGQPVAVSEEWRLSQREWLAHSGSAHRSER